MIKRSSDKFAICARGRKQEVYSTNRVCISSHGTAAYLSTFAKQEASAHSNFLSSDDQHIHSTISAPLYVPCFKDYIHVYNFFFKRLATISFTIMCMRKKKLNVISELRKIILLLKSIINTQRRSIFARRLHGHQVERCDISSMSIYTSHR